MRIIKITIVSTLIGIICLGIFINCSPTVGPTEIVDEYIRDGWKLFEQKLYSEAANKFSQAIDKAPKDERGYHGAGWCKLLQNQPSQAITFFDQAIVNGNASLDPIAGLEFAYLANQNYADAIVKGETVLQTNASYYFSHNPQINILDIRIALAMAYYHEGRLSDAQTQVDYLKPDNHLNPTTPNTWVVDQIVYDSYAAALMALIDLLDILYGM